MNHRSLNHWLAACLGLWLACVPARADTYDDLLKTAAAQMHQREFADAVDTLKVAIRAAPSRYEAFAVIGLLLHGAQQPKEAQEAVTEALKRVPAADRAKLDGIVARVFPNGAPAVAGVEPGVSRMADPPAKATKETPWVNSLGMKFVPVPGTDVLFCIWHTRVQDFEAFATANSQSWEKPDFAQGPTHPAVKVSWQDGQEFCKWLTERERQAGQLPAGASYRLPADWEWSVAVGLNEPRGGIPKQKSGKIKGAYPWGTQWPPPRGAGNYDRSLNVDDFGNTSPVGHFTANAFGLCDMGGNAWQWCNDWYDGEQSLRVLRGGSWIFSTQGRLLSSFRNFNPSDGRLVSIGFRCVLVVGSTR